MPLFKFTHLRAIEYTQPAFVAKPGEEYELDKAPDELNWEPVKSEKATTNGRK